MTRENFGKIIKILSFWKIDKRKKNYRLPDGSKLSAYLIDLVTRFLKKNELAFTKNGNLFDVVGNKIFIPFGDDEPFNEDKQNHRIKMFVDWLIY